MPRKPPKTFKWRQEFQRRRVTCHISKRCPRLQKEQGGTGGGQGWDCEWEARGAARGTLWGLRGGAGVARRPRCVLGPEDDREG